MLGIVNFNKIDTTPGADQAFAPPEGYAGDYIELLRDRFKNHPMYRQHIYLAAQKLARGQITEANISGPYRQMAIQICKKIHLRK